MLKPEVETVRGSYIQLSSAGQEIPGQPKVYMARHQESVS